MQWLPQGLPLRRWVQRCISRFFSTNNWKNTYVRTTTPDMHPVCDIFTFLDSNVFYIAYKGKSISWIFINFVHWNCSQTVDPPLLKDSDKSLICLQHFSLLPIFRAFHYGFTQEGRRKDHDLRMKHFVPFFFSLFFLFYYAFFFFFFSRHQLHSLVPKTSLLFSFSIHLLLPSHRFYLLFAGIISCMACSWLLQFDKGDLISLAYKKVFMYPQWYSQIIFSSGTSHPQYQENLQQNSVIYRIATPPGIQVWASDMGTGDFFHLYIFTLATENIKQVQSQKTTVGLLLSLPLVQIKPGTSWTLIFLFSNGRLYQQVQS